MWYRKCCWANLTPPLAKKNIINLWLVLSFVIFFYAYRPPSICAMWLNKNFKRWHWIFTICYEEHTFQIRNLNSNSKYFRQENCSLLSNNHKKVKVVIIEKIVKPYWICISKFELLVICTTAYCILWLNLDFGEHDRKRFSRPFHILINITVNKTKKHSV